MEPSETKSEIRMALCSLGAAVLPFTIFSAYLSISRSAAIQTGDADWLALGWCVFTGVACIAVMPIRSIHRIIFACLYGPVLWFALSWYGLYYVIVVCGDTL
jgi:hypothetical protein